MSCLCHLALAGCGQANLGLPPSSPSGARSCYQIHWDSLLCISSPLPTHHLHRCLREFYAWTEFKSSTRDPW